MSHNLFGERFADARGPAWHELGQVMGTKVPAREAYRRIGHYEVRLAEAVAEGVSLGKKAILRSPTADDPETRVFGIVSDDYHLITPEDMCALFDEHVGKPVETIGVLGYGENMFLSVILPTIDVKGDEVEFYMLLSNWMNGLRSAELMTTGVRVVCQNTLLAAERVATEKVKIIHDKNAKQRMAEWMRDTYAQAETTTKVLKDLFQAMATQRVKDAEARKLFEYAYPMPNPPKRNAPKATMDQRLIWWQENVDLATRRREGAKALFEGMGTGMDLPAAKGTLWGAYNAVVETEDYRKGRGGTQIAASAMFGERAAIKRRAFDFATQMVKK